MTPSESAAAEPETPSGAFRSLRSCLLLAFAPLGLVLVAGTAFTVSEVRLVHVDVQRMFEESREVEAARSLRESLQGIALWSDVRDQIPLGLRKLVVSDTLRHLAQAETSLGLVRRPPAGDPSREPHQLEESSLCGALTAELAKLREVLGGAGDLEALPAVITAARHNADALAAMLHLESREIGGDLDQRSEDIVRLSWLLALAALFSLGIAGFLFARLVLRPLADLSRSAEEFGRGTLEHLPPVRRHDELGLLAATFCRMAGSLRRSQENLEQRIEQRSRELLSTARLADIGALAAGIAHEINNPLASIAACAEGLLRESAASQAGGSESMRRYLSIVRTEAMRASEITRRLLLLAHQDGGQRQPLHLDEEAREVAAMLQHEARQRAIELDLVGVRSVPTIQGDRAEWRQVLLNLMRNALAASPEGGQISVRCAAANRRLSLAVEDQGPGIPAADLERVFEPFFTTKEPGQGTGLGLAIVRRIVHAHGGCIRAVNRESGGVRFEIDLPSQ